jgi:uncharacterized membrane protein YebE (DUF533 family)
MWRTLFAITHADGIVSNEEIRYMVEALEDIPFDDEQTKTLNDDIKTPKDPVEMFSRISDVRDQARFFQYARDIVHIDGEYGEAEQALLLKLKRLHLQNADVDQLIGNVALELEPETPAPKVAWPPAQKKKGRKRDIVFSFRRRFLENLD